MTEENKGMVPAWFGSGPVLDPLLIPKIWQKSGIRD